VTEKNNLKKANLEEGYCIAKRNTQGTEKTQAMEWLSVAHIDSVNTVVASDDDAYVKIPIDRLLEHNVVSDGTGLSRDLIRLHNEMAKLMIKLKVPKTTSRGRILYVFKSVVVFPSLSYDPDTREVTVKISGDATPQFYNLSNRQHTSLDIDIVLKNITGFWARKIYAICREQLYHNSDIIEFNIEVDELRSALGVFSSKSFEDFKILNRDILKPALWELGWDFIKEKHVTTSTPKKPVADIDLYIRATKVTRGRKVTHIKFQVRPKAVSQPNLIGRTLQSITAPTKEYLTSIGWSQWNRINQLGETYGSLVLEKAIIKFKNESSPRAKTNVAGLLNTELPTLIEQVLNNQSKEERQEKRNQRGRLLLERWKVSHPFETWKVEQKEALIQAMKKNNLPVPDVTYTEDKWHKTGLDEVKKTLDKEEAEQKQQRLF
jgi:plasmid replication initiation protein